MKQIETNFLIYDLAKKCNTKSKVGVFKFMFLSLGLTLFFLFMYLLNSNLRPDLVELIAHPAVNVFYLQLVTFSVTGLLGLYLSYKESIPGQSDYTSYKILTSIFYIMWLVLFAVLGLLVFNDASSHNHMICSLACIERTILGLIVPVTILAYYMKKGFVLKTYNAVLTMTFTAFSFASFLNLFICPETNNVFILCVHNLIILPIIFVFLMAVKLLGVNHK